MTRVQTKVRLAPGLTLDVDRDDGGDFYATVGGWTVETIAGYLVVRQPGRPASEPPLLKVPVREGERS